MGYNRLLLHEICIAYDRKKWLSVAYSEFHGTRPITEFVSQRYTNFLYAVPNGMCTYIKIHNAYNEQSQIGVGGDGDGSSSSNSSTCSSTKQYCH